LDMLKRCVIVLHSLAAASFVIDQAHQLLRFIFQRTTFMRFVLVHAKRMLHLLNKHLSFVLMLGPAVASVLLLVYLEISFSSCVYVRGKLELSILTFPSP
jgi:hypothetical protein